MWGFYIPTMVCVVVATLYMLRYYAAPGVPVFVRCVAVTAWVTSISIVALVPIDVWNTLQQQSGGTGGPLGILWSISYWTTQVMTWALVPLTMGFIDAGQFSFAGRVVRSIKDNILFWIILGSCGIVGVLLLLMSGQLTFSALPQLALTLSNTYGLVAGVFLLGFGLVEIPRALWNNSDPEARLHYMLYRVGRAADTLEDAAFELQSVITVVEATHQPMARRDPLRPLMDVIYKYADEHSPFRPSMCLKDSNGRINLDDLKDGDLDYGCDEEGLANLRCRLRRACHDYEGDKASYENAVKEACDLEAVVKCRKAGAYNQPALSSAAGGPGRQLMMFRCIIKPWLLKLAALGLAAVSFMVVWSEATIGSGRHPDLSPFSQAIHAAKHGEVATQLLVMAPLAYMCTCCHYALFRLGVLKFPWLARWGIGFVYHLVPHCTHSQSLLRNSGWVCRFIAPICYNFLHIIRMHIYLSPGQTTVFSKKMGAALSDVPIFGQGFNSWFPIVVVAWCGLLFFNVWAGVARVVLPSRYRWEEGGTGAGGEHSARGRALLVREQECQSRGRPIGECLDLWGTLEAPGTPGARARVAASGKPRAPGGGSAADPGSNLLDPAQGRSDTSKRWSRANLSSATQAALGQAPAGVPPRPSPLGRAAGRPPQPPGPPLQHSLVHNKHGSSDSVGSLGNAGGLSQPRHSRQPSTGGLDDIFARMGPDARIDDDTADSNLLGGAEDSAAGAASWRPPRGARR